MLLPLRCGCCCGGQTPPRRCLLHCGLSGNGPIHQNTVFDGGISVEVDRDDVILFVAVPVILEALCYTIVNVLICGPLQSSPIYHETSTTARPSPERWPSSKGFLRRSGIADQTVFVATLFSQGLVLLVGICRLF